MDVFSSLSSRIDTSAFLKYAAERVNSNTTFSPNELFRALIPSNDVTVDRNDNCFWVTESGKLSWLFFFNGLRYEGACESLASCPPGMHSPNGDGVLHFPGGYCIRANFVHGCPSGTCVVRFDSGLECSMTIKDFPPSLYSLHPQGVSSWLDCGLSRFGSSITSISYNNTHFEDPELNNLILHLNVFQNELVLDVDDLASHAFFLPEELKPCVQLRSLAFTRHDVSSVAYAIQDSLDLFSPYFSCYADDACECDRDLCRFIAECCKCDSEWGLHMGLRELDLGAEKEVLEIGVKNVNELRDKESIDGLTKENELIMKEETKNIAITVNNLAAKEDLKDTTPPRGRASTIESLQLHHIPLNAIDITAFSDNITSLVLNDVNLTSTDSTSIHLPQIESIVIRSACRSFHSHSDCRVTALVFAADSILFSTPQPSAKPQRSFSHCARLQIEHCHVLLALRIDATFSSVCAMTIRGA